jgi:hypothetical protein
VYREGKFFFSFPCANSSVCFATARHVVERRATSWHFSFFRLLSLQFLFPRIISW